MTSSSPNSLKNLFSLQGKTALVTGGAGYLGSDICDSLAELGASIIVASRNGESCQSKANTLIRTYDIQAFAHKLDICDDNSIESLYSFIESNFNGLDILVNCSWSGKKNTWESITFDDWQYDIDVCLNGPFRVIKTLFPLIRKDGDSSILNIASMYGKVAPDYNMYLNNDHANPPSYGAAKAGIIQFTRYLASFLSPYSIRVNSISPGPFPFPETISRNPEFIKSLSRKVPLGRVGMPHELKGVTALLCSRAGSYINGQDISVDGGWTSW